MSEYRREALERIRLPSKKKLVALLKDELDMMASCNDARRFASIKIKAAMEYLEKVGYEGIRMMNQLLSVCIYHENLDLPLTGSRPTVKSSGTSRSQLRLMRSSPKRTPSLSRKPMSHGTMLVCTLRSIVFADCAWSFAMYNSLSIRSSYSMSLLLLVRCLRVSIDARHADILWKHDLRFLSFITSCMSSTMMSRHTSMRLQANCIRFRRTCATSGSVLMNTARQLS